MLVADTKNHCIRRVLAGTSSQPASLRGRWVYRWAGSRRCDGRMAETPAKLSASPATHDSCQVLIALAGWREVRTVAGGPGAGHRDGLFSDALFSSPEALTVLN